jgi:YD repeat-containing protein
VHHARVLADRRRRLPGGVVKRATPVRGPLHTVALLLGAALPLVLSQSTGWGAPADITQVAAPMVGTDPPKARDVAAGDASVSTQNGTLSYSYPIVVPPGRGGAAPQLALSYSSQAPLYGDIAAGWSLNLPEIKEDTADGRMVAHHEPLFAAGEHHPRWVSSLGGNLQLVAVTEPAEADVAEAFRALHDTSFLRYERLTDGSAAIWRVRSLDGSTYVFGESALVDGAPVARLRSRAPLTSTTDAFGNVVSYEYDFVDDEYRLAKVQWGRNDNASIGHFAELTLTWAPATVCSGGDAADIPVGAALDYRLGDRWVNGGAKLTQLVATAYNPATLAVEHTRTVTLGYDAAAESCTATVAPARYLTSIQQSASGVGLVSVSLPPITFSYGPVTQGLTSTTGWQSVPSWEAGSHHPATISWGLRFSGSRWPTIQSMFLDLDGDGLLDRVSMDEAPEPEECVLYWYRNLGDGEFDAPVTQTLRRLPWAGSQAERCALNYQFTEIENAEDNSYTPGAYLARRFMDMNDDGRPELVAAIHNYPGFDPDRVGFELDEETAFGDSWPSCTPAAGCPLPDESCSGDVGCAGATPVACATVMNKLASGDPPPDQVAAFERCGKYPWLIFWNEGDGQFATDAEIRLMDQPLEVDSGASSMNGAPWSERSGVRDLDGDGRGDYFIVGTMWDEDDEVQRDGLWWWVWRGDGTGNYSRSTFTGLPYMYWAPFTDGHAAYAQVHDNTSFLFGVAVPDRYSVQRATMFDFNGDGITDYLRHVDAGADDELQVHFGDGLAFDGWQWSGHKVASGDAVQKSHIYAEEWDAFDERFVEEGTREFQVRTVDLDNDGRLDLVKLGDTASAATVRLNNGSRWLAGRNLVDNGLVKYREPLQQIVTTGPTANPGEYEWAAVGDYLDLDGDGLPEWVEMAGTMRRHYNAVVDGKAPRLLWKVDNGRGHTTSAQYAPLADRTVVAVDSATGKVSPASGWVVKSLTSHDAFESSDSTVTYAYRYPHYGPDNRNHWSMRGFEEVITTGASGAKTTEHFGYDVDWSGRKTKVVVSSAEAPTKAHSISATTWGKKTLFAGQVEIIVETDVHAYVCDTGQTTPQCEASPALMTREVPTWTTLQSTTAPTGHQLVWVQTERTMQDAQVYGDDDRRAVTTYALASDATTYRLREVETATFWNNLGADQLATRTTTGWDATYRYPVTKAVASTSNPADDLVTHTTYDSLTGNVLAVRKPQQYAASGVAAPATTYQYDVRKLFVVTTTNELGHVVDTVTEYGTGEVLFTKGPNVRQCTTCTGPMKEEHNVVRDALGRPLEEEEVTSPNGGEYTLWKVATHTYVDAPSGTISPHVIDRTLIDYVAGPNARWTETRTDVDGLGRPIRSTVEVDVADAPNDAVTTYDYDHRGKLVAVTVPDPSQNGTQTVTFTYEFDSLGRPTSMRRPDAATLAHRSGVDISYGPSTETRTEVPGIAGGPAASTETQRDAFGRMIAVSEQTGVGTSATTSYSFGPSGQVSLIEDPDGVVTAMEHDLAGRRTSITRGGRTWVYGYDRNGNMISERVPTVDQNASTLAKYTTLHAYDALDREITRSVAPREWDIQADRDYFGIGTWTMTYDVGGIGGNGNKKGLLTSATAPGGVYTHQVTYDAQSNVTKDRRSFAMGGVSGTREWDATYLPGGQDRRLHVRRRRDAVRQRRAHEDQDVLRQPRPAGEGDVAALGRRRVVGAAGAAHPQRGRPGDQAVGAGRRADRRAAVVPGHERGVWLRRDRPADVAGGDVGVHGQRRHAAGAPGRGVLGQRRSEDAGAPAVADGRGGGLQEVRVRLRPAAPAGERRGGRGGRRVRGGDGVLERGTYWPGDDRRGGAAGDDGSAGARCDARVWQSGGEPAGGPGAAEGAQGRQWRERRRGLRDVHVRRRRQHDVTDADGAGHRAGPRRRGRTSTTVRTSCGAWWGRAGRSRSTGTTRAGSGWRFGSGRVAWAGRSQAFGG